MSWGALATGRKFDLRRMVELTASVPGVRAFMMLSPEAPTEDSKVSNPSCSLYGVLPNLHPYKAVGFAQFRVWFTIGGVVLCHATSQSLC